MNTKAQWGKADNLLPFVRKYAIIEHPIVMGGMTGVGTPELAAAVSK